MDATEYISPEFQMLSSNVIAVLQKLLHVFLLFACECIYYTVLSRLHLGTKLFTSCKLEQ